VASEAIPLIYVASEAMNPEPLDELERHLASARHVGAPAALRGHVLSDIDRELRAARWDRRLARAAVVLLVVGVGVNASLVFEDGSKNMTPHRQLMVEESQRAIIDTAILVAEATNGETGRQFARQLAALSGRELTDQEIATIDAATRDRG
jgi:hypothetical protein